MCLLSEPAVQNVVLHFKVYGAGNRSRLVWAGKDADVDTEKKNFFVLKEEKYSFTIFPASGDIIVTGIPCGKKIQPALRVFLRLTGVAHYWTRCGLKIVNSTYTGKLACTHDVISTSYVLRKYKDHLRDANRRDIDIHFRTQFFPGARLHWKDKRGTVNFFNNGNYVIVGVRSKREARRLYRELCAIMEKFWRTLKPPTSCAWSVDSC